MSGWRCGRTRLWSGAGAFVIFNSRPERREQRGIIGGIDITIDAPKENATQVVGFHVFDLFLNALHVIVGPHVPSVLVDQQRGFRNVVPNFLIASRISQPNDVFVVVDPPLVTTCRAILGVPI